MRLYKVAELLDGARALAARSANIIHKLRRLFQTVAPYKVLHYDWPGSFKLLQGLR